MSRVSGDFNGGGTDFNTSGFGLQAGYLYDMGTLVAGGELSYSASMMRAASCPMLSSA
jgi:outer membrane immunogenic protein